MWIGYETVIPTICGLTTSASLVTYSYCDPRVKEHHLLAALGPLYDAMRKQGQHIYVWVFMLSTITQGLIIQAGVTKNEKVQFFLAAIEWVIIFIRQYCKPYHGKCNTWHIGCGYGRMRYGLGGLFL